MPRLLRPSGLLVPVKAGPLVIRITGGVPSYAHGSWVGEAPAGWPRHPVKGKFFRCTFAHEQEAVNRATWKILRGACLDAHTDVLPVSTGEIVSIVGNDHMALAPDYWRQTGVVWTRDPTKPIVNREQLGAAGDNDATRVRMLENWAANRLSGWPRKLRDMEGAWAGKTVVVLGGGPSLPENAAHLRRFGEHVIVLATNRAPDHVDPALIDAWITVDHALQPSYLADPERYRAFPLVFAELASNAAMVEHVGPARVVWYGSELHPPERVQMQPDADECGAIDASMNVTYTASVLAYYLGARAVVYIGNDLSYRPVERVPYHAGVACVKTPGRSLAVDAPGNMIVSDGEALAVQDGARRVPCERYPGRLQTWQDNCMVLPDMNGDAVVIEPILDVTAQHHQALGAFMQRACAEGRRFVQIINATGHGRFFGGGGPGDGVLLAKFEELAPLMAA